MFATFTFAETLNSWAEAWSAVMLRNTVEAAVLLVVVSLIWLLLRRRISSQLTIGLFSLLLLKLAIPLPMVIPGSIARFWPSPRLASEFAVGAISRSLSSVETVSAPAQVPDERSQPVQIPGEPRRSPDRLRAAQDECASRSSPRRTPTLDDARKSASVSETSRRASQLGASA